MRQPVVEGSNNGPLWRNESRICLDNIPRLRSSSPTIDSATMFRSALSKVVRVADGEAAAGPATVEWKGRNKPAVRIGNGRRCGLPSRSPTAFESTTRTTRRCGTPTKRSIKHCMSNTVAGSLRELIARLRTGRSLRVPRSRTRRRPGGHDASDVTINRRPDEVTDRMVAGRWEGDLIIGTDHSAIGTLVERTTRVTMLLHLPRPQNTGSCRGSRTVPPWPVTGR